MTAPRLELEDDPFDDLIPADRRKKLAHVPESDPFEDLVPKSSVFDKTKDFVTDVAKGVGHFATHPWEIVTTPAHEAADALFTPVEGSESSGMGGRGGPARLPQGTKVTKENTPGAITDAERKQATREAMVDIPLLAAGGTKALYPMIAASGAVHNPEHPVKGAAEMVAGAGVFHAAGKLPNIADVSDGMIEAGTKDLATEAASDQAHAKSGMSPSRRPAPPPPIEPPADAEGVSFGEAPARQIGPAGRSAARWLDVPHESIGEIRRRPAAPPPVPQVTPEQVAAQLHPATPPDVAVRIAESANQNAIARATEQQPRRELTGSEFGGPETSTDQLRENARSYAYENLRNKSFVNEDRQMPLRVNRPGIDHTLRHADNTEGGRAHAQSMGALDQLLEDATYLGSEPNRDPKQARGLKAVHRFEKPITIDGQPFKALLVIKETANGNFFYDHRLDRFEPVTPPDAGTATGPETAEPAPPIVPNPHSQEGGNAADETGLPGNNTPGSETAHYPPEAEISPVASANGEFVPRPGVMRKVNRAETKGPTPTSLPPGATPEEIAAATPEPVARGRKAPDLFDEARTKGGDLRPFHRVSDDGLIRELNGYQTKIVDAHERALYNWTEDENFHSTEDGRAVASATRIGGKGVSQQAKALQNLADYDRIMKEIEGELAKRGHTPDTIFERQQHLGELDATLERDAIEHADKEDLADVDFNFDDIGNESAGKLESRENLHQTEPQLEKEGSAPSEPPVSDILNVAKLDLGDKTAEERVAAQLEQHRELRDSNKQTFQEADVNRAEIVRELVAGDGKALDPKAAKKLSGEELLARRDVVRQNDQLIADLSKSIESGELTVAEHAQAHDLMQKAVEHNDALLSDLVTGSSQKGRDLNLLRRMANRSLDPDVWQLQAKRLLGDRPLTDEISTTIRRLAKEAADACGGAE